MVMMGRCYDVSVTLHTLFFCKMMRNLYPQVSVADDITPLDTSLRQWRRSAALAMELLKQEIRSTVKKMD